MIILLDIPDLYLESELAGGRLCVRDAEELPDLPAARHLQQPAVHPPGRGHYLQALSVR